MCGGWCVSCEMWGRWGVGFCEGCVSVGGWGEACVRVYGGGVGKRCGWGKECGVCGGGMMSVRGESGVMCWWWGE